ncbi:unnamed protein product [Ixodes hexagonus]
MPAAAQEPYSPHGRVRRLMEALPDDPPPCRREAISACLWRRVLVDSIASFLLTALTSSPKSTVGGNLEASAALGASAAALTYCLPSDMNPAVTLSRLVTRRVSVLSAALCICAQCVAACAGATAVYGLTPVAERRRFADAMRFRFADGLHASQAFGAEFLGSVLVVLVTLAVADDEGSRRSCCPVGLAYAAASLSAYRFTGAGLNPARSLGPALVANCWDGHWVYWVGPMLAGLMAAFTHEYTRSTRLKTRQVVQEHLAVQCSVQPGNHVKRGASRPSNDTELTVTSNNDCRV